MADLIKIKSGAVSDKRPEMPKLDESELGYRTDEKALYIGTNGGNVRLCGADDLEAISKLMEDITTRLDALENPGE